MNLNYYIIQNNDAMFIVKDYEEVVQPYLYYKDGYTLSTHDGIKYVLHIPCIVNLRLNEKAHDLAEVIKATVHRTSNWSEFVDVTPEELKKHLTEGGINLPNKIYFKDKNGY